jgi:endo-1,4-beta-xylanase
MNHQYKPLLVITAAIALLASCTKMRDTGTLTAVNFSDTASALKDATDVPIGVAIDYTPMLNDTKYAAVVKRDFDNVTFGYNMKHGAIVQNNGTLNFTNADALVAASSGVAVFGHTLSWHANQNAGYLKSFSGLTVAAAVELVTNNPGFENGITGWGLFNMQNGAAATATSVASEVHAGNGAMKVVNPTANAGGEWRVQVSSAELPTTIGKQYVVTYWVKAASAGGSIRLSTGPTAQQYQGGQTIGTTWQQVSYQFTASLNATSFLFDMGLLANTYYIDDASLKEVVAAPNSGQIATKLDQALNTFITGMVSHYKGTVKAWDVVNEVVSPSGALRTVNNSTDISDKTASDILIWSEYMGRDYVYKAFKYAEAADPAAKLFINDYGLESSAAKVDSLIALVKEMKARGAKIDGIGTQMHIAWNADVAGIDAMMQKLGATGLLIRISEMDVKANPLFKPNFAMTFLDGNYQAAMYKYVIQSYLKYIPKAQQHGITIWGITDNTSWLYKNGTEFPLMYNADYSKKQAYAAVLQALKGQ